MLVYDIVLDLNRHKETPPPNILFVTMNQYQVGMVEEVSGSTMIFLSALQ